MTTPREISNTDDVIDSRDIIERIKHLEERESITEAGEAVHSDDTLTEDERAELDALRKLESEANGSPDWKYGEALIRDSYFTEYAQQLAEDCDMVPRDLKWPCNCIDWEKAASELQYDYYTVDFDGVTYWIRS